jgi:hypothetical protein
LRLCLATLLAATFSQGLHAQSVEVPDFFAAGDLEVQDIEDRMADVGWEGDWELVTEVAIDDVAPNKKISEQVPTKGSKIFEGDKVHLVVPNLGGGEGDGVAPVFLYLALALFFTTVFFAWCYYRARGALLRIRSGGGQGDD